MSANPRRCESRGQPATSSCHMHLPQHDLRVGGYTALKKPSRTWSYCERPKNKTHALQSPKRAAAYHIRRRHIPSVVQLQMRKRHEGDRCVSVRSLCRSNWPPNVPRRRRQDVFLTALERAVSYCPPSSGKSSSATIYM